MKEWYTAQELTDLRLNSLPKSKSNVISRAKKDGWTSQKRTGKGGGLEYAFDSLPKDVQNEIKARQLRELIPAPSRVSSDERAALAKARDVGLFDGNQRNTADARMMMALLVGQSQADMGSTRTVAINYISKLSRNNALPTINGVDYNTVCTKAVAKNNKRAGVGTRQLHQWVIDADKCQNGVDALALLAPERQGRKELQVADSAWLSDFMAVYRNTNGVCVAEAYRLFYNTCQARQVVDALPYEIPSAAQVRTVLNKIPMHLRQIGRQTGASLRALKTYVKRDWSMLCANDVWVGDGHSLKMKVAHPDHGRPMTPELTLIMDAASRYVVGWSLAYSESCIAVADALRSAMVQNGIPAIYYSDNGSGQKNKTFDADITGILPRLGISHQTGIPGNPQGRGIIERLMKTLAHPIARQFETYFGPNADADTVRRVLTATDSLAKTSQNVANKDKPLTPKQAWAKGRLPSWDELISVITAAVNWYNYEHKHSEIGGITPASMRQYLLGKLERDDYVTLTQAESRDLFRPSVVRVVQRAWLSVYNNHYWHEALEDYNGKKVQVCIDQHNPKTVIVRDLKGRYLCEALLNGNTKDAFALTLVEHKKHARAKARIKRLDDEKGKAMLELRKVIEVQSNETVRTLSNTNWIETDVNDTDEQDDGIVIYDYAKWENVTKAG